MPGPAGPQTSETAIIRALQRQVDLLVTAHKLNTLRDVDPTGIFDGAGPVWNSTRQVFVLSDSSSGTQRWFHDSWTISDATAATYAMSLPAVNQAAIVHLNGLILREDTDYSLDYGAGVITISTSRAVGDVLGVRYVIAGSSDTPSPTGGTALLGANTQTLPAGTKAGDTVIIFTAIPASRSINALNGYTDRGSCTVSHASADAGTLTCTMHVLTKVVTSGSDVPTYTGVGASGGGQDIAWGAYTFPGTVNILDTKTDTVADDTTGSTPAVTVGSTTARCWITISNNGTLNPPDRGTNFGVADGSDIDRTLAIDTDRTASPATETVSAGWMLATVAIA